jgi:hypothetical protein
MQILENTPLPMRGVQKNQLMLFGGNTIGKRKKEER